MPICEQTKCLQFRDPDQPKFHVVYWTRTEGPDPNTPFLLVWNHGLGEHSGRYRKFADTLLSNVEELDAVISFDMRNHGQSDGAPGATRYITDHVQDLYKAILPEVSLFFGMGSRVVVGGHSLGGVVAAGAMAKPDCLIEPQVGEICGVILSAPAVQIFVNGTLNKALQPIAPLIARLPGSRALTKTCGIDPEDLCQDEDMVKAYVEDPLVHDKISIGLGADLLSYGQTVIDSLEEANDCVLNNKPVLVLHGLKDKITSIEGSRNLVKAINKKGNAKLVEIDDSYHESFNESAKNGSEKFYKTVCEFLKTTYADVLALETERGLTNG